MVDALADSSSRIELIQDGGIHRPWINYRLESTLNRYLSLFTQFSLYQVVVFNVGWKSLEYTNCTVTL